MNLKKLATAATIAALLVNAIYYFVSGEIVLGIISILVLMGLYFLVVKTENGKYRLDPDFFLKYTEKLDTLLGTFKPDIVLAVGRTAGIFASAYSKINRIDEIVVLPRRKLADDSFEIISFFMPNKEKLGGKKILFLQITNEHGRTLNAGFTFLKNIDVEVRSAVILQSDAASVLHKPDYAVEECATQRLFDQNKWLKGRI